MNVLERFQSLFPLVINRWFLLCIACTLVIFILIGTKQFLLQDSEWERERQRREEMIKKKRFQIVVIVREDCCFCEADVFCYSCDALLSAVKKTEKYCPQLGKIWQRHGSSCSVRICQDEYNLRKIASMASHRGFTISIVWNESYTGEKEPVSVAIGPAPAGLINKVTRNSKEY